MGQDKGLAGPGGADLNPVQVSSGALSTPGPSEA